MGLPTRIQKSKTQTFRELKEKVERKLAGWKEKLSLSGDKEVLIKVMALAIPVYTMACFKLPLQLYKQINSIISKFWWGQKDEKRKMAWISWEEACKRK